MNIVKKALMAVVMLFFPILLNGMTQEKVSDIPSSAHQMGEVKEHLESILPRMAQGLSHCVVIRNARRLERLQQRLEEAQSKQQVGGIEAVLATDRVVFYADVKEAAIKLREEQLSQIYSMAGQKVLDSLDEACRTLERCQDPHEYFEKETKHVVRNDSYSFHTFTGLRDNPAIPNRVPAEVMEDLLAKISVKAQALQPHFEAYRQEKFLPGLGVDDLDSWQLSKLSKVTLSHLIQHLIDYTHFRLRHEVDNIHGGSPVGAYIRLSQAQKEDYIAKVLSILTSETSCREEKEKAAYVYYMHSDKEERTEVQEVFGPSIEGFEEFALKAQSLRLIAFLSSPLYSDEERQKAALELFELDTSRMAFARSKRA